MDEQSGFNLLQAAVFEGEYSIVLNAHGLLENFVKEMEHVTTGNNAKVFPGKTAGDILSLIKIRKPSHDSIERLYNECAEENRRLTELQWATSDDDAEQAVELVLNDGVDINARTSDNDYTALLQASRSSSIQFIEALLDLGADVDIQRRESKATPVLSATKWNNYLAARLFLRYGTKVNVQVNDGKTPLHWAVILGNENLVRLLLQHNADVNIQDNDGCTALHLSLLQSHINQRKIFDTLVKHKAQTDKKDAVRLEILKNEAELREQHLRFEIGDPLTAKENAGDIFTQDAEILTKDRSVVKQAQPGTVSNLKSESTPF